MKTISVISATYVSGYKVRLSFNDGIQKTIDLAAFFSTHSHPQYNKYKNISSFKKFKIEMGNIVWGKDWDLIFPVYSLYKGRFD